MAMVDSGTLFWLIFVALALMNACLFIVVSLMIKEDRNKRSKTKQKCTHFFGYLSVHPRNKPIPDECFSCIKAIECVKEVVHLDDEDVGDIVEEEAPVIVVAHA